ncbi:MAG: putative 26S proteasome non-ATPase regulatory subunit 11 [Streblomastix strix]|uniref:Putative 26S proteasome non-ATPase regulatory subunit 11 n=1 Tax=Streblomastix strix TaxID=222440 RepID=A0A5J4XA96_9EUKA|nr:MAG: putative 26S proteasome non-ATPase regulatory subunit 11 [Streblomastix strix]
MSRITTRQKKKELNMIVEYIDSDSDTQLNLEQPPIKRKRSEIEISSSGEEEINAQDIIKETLQKQINSESQNDLKDKTTGINPESNNKRIRIENDDVTEINSQILKTEKRKIWTPLEDAQLLKGIAKHGLKWATIVCDPELTWSRTDTQLKDRYRTLLKDEQWSKQLARKMSKKEKEESQNKIEEINMEKDVEQAQSGQTEIEEEVGLNSKAKALSEQSDARGIITLLTEIKPRLMKMASTRMAKIVRAFIDFLVSIHDIDAEREQAIQSWIDFALEEKKVFLRQRLEICLCAFYYQVSQFQKMRTLLMKLLKETKKLDDKRLLVDIHILESQCFIRLMDLPRARAAITSARMEANVIYVPPNLQSRLDYWTGMLYSQERDFKTGFSYFYEAYESYDSQGYQYKVDASHTLKMVALCKTMQGKPEECVALLAGKIALKYNNSDIQAMKRIATAYEHRSLDEYQSALTQFPSELQGDFAVASHLEELGDTLFEQHLQRLVEPYSVVEIDHIAKLIKIDPAIVEKKLAQMILEQKIDAQLDQETRWLTIIEREDENKLLQNTLTSLVALDKALDGLGLKSTFIK